MNLLASLIAFFSIISAARGQDSTPDPANDLISLYNCYTFKGKDGDPDTSSSFCTDAGYNRTALPNFRNGSNIHEIEMELRTFIQVYDSSEGLCSNALTHFLCSYYLPQCNPTATEDLNADKRIPPCRELCLYVRQTCEPVVKQVTEWPSHLECHHFPSAKNESLCFPAFTKITDYQNLNEWHVGGHPIPTKPPQKADKFWMPPEENPTSKQSSLCPVASLSVRNTSGDEDYYRLANYSGCGVKCSSLYFSTQYTGIPVFVLILCILGILATAFTMATFLIDRERFLYPERPIIFLSLSYFVICLVFIIGSIAKLSNNGGASSLACSAGPDQHVPFVFQHLPQNNLDSVNAASGMCVAMFFFIYWATMASLVWWDILTICWLLAATLKWAEEAIEKFWLLYHFIAWGIPLLQTIIAMALQYIDGDQLSGVCFIGNFNKVGLGVFVFMPMIVYLIIGLVALVVGYFSLISIHRELSRDKTKSRKLGRLILRVGLFSSLYVLPNVILVILYIYEMAMKDAWQLAYLCENKQAHEEVYGCSEAQERPDFSFYYVKYFMWLIVATNMGVWIISWKTVKAWRNLFKDVLPCLKNKGIDSSYQGKSSSIM